MKRIICMLLALALTLHFFFQYFVEFMTQVVEEQGVYNLVDILYRGIVHSSTAACLRVECAFKHCTKDSRRNLAPVEVE